MTTRERIKKAITRYYLTVLIFFALTFSGMSFNSWILGVSGFVGIIVSSRIFGKQVTCPLCRAPLYVDSRRGPPMNFCPGCARSVDEEESSATES